MNEPEDRTSDPALSRIYRQTADGEPSVAVDAAILAAARQAVAKPVRRARWWQRLTAPVALAATVVLAVMLSLTVDRQPETPALPPGVPAEQPPAPVEQRELQKAPPPAKAESLRPPGKTETPARAKMASKPASGGAPILDAAPAAAPLPGPLRAAPAPALPQRNESSAERADGVDSSLKEETRRFEARKAAPAAKSLAPSQWIEEIRALRQQGRFEEASRRLAEFRQAYPDYPLPEDMLK